MERLLDGLYTLDDQTMYDMLGWLAQEEGIRLEPSALAGMAGPQRICAAAAYQQRHGFSQTQLGNATHLVWATGGGMVPEDEMEQYGKRTLILTQCRKDGSAIRHAIA